MRPLVARDDNPKIELSSTEGETTTPSIPESKHRHQTNTGGFAIRKKLNLVLNPKTT
jgi:hypothetical protein